MANTATSTCQKCNDLGDILLPEIGSVAYCDCLAGRNARAMYVPMMAPAPRRALTDAAGSTMGQKPFWRTAKPRRAFAGTPIARHAV